MPLQAELIFRAYSNMHATVIENLIEKFEQLPGIGRKSAERTLENIIPFIEGKLFLKVNRKKTKVAHISKVKYLGYTYYRYKGTTKRN